MRPWLFIGLFQPSGLGVLPDSQCTCHVLFIWTDQHDLICIGSLEKELGESLLFIIAMVLQGSFCFPFSQKIQNLKITLGLESGQGVMHFYYVTTCSLLLIHLISLIV